MRNLERPVHNVLITLWASVDDRQWWEDQTVISLFGKRWDVWAIEEVETQQGGSFLEIQLEIEEF